jgi:hypothetical protein
MVEPAYILFDGQGSGQFAFGCVSGIITGTGGTAGIAIDWNGRDEQEGGRRLRGSPGPGLTEQASRGTIRKKGP